MAVALGASAHLDFGTVYSANQTGLTVALTITPSSAANGRIATKWGGDGTFEQSFNLQCFDSGRVLWGIKASSGVSNHQQTSTGTVAIGTLLRIVGRFTASTTPQLWINGSQASTTTYFSDGTPANASGGTQGEVALGFESDESINGMAGDYAEFAIWLEAVPDWMAIAYGKGLSPRGYRQNGALYCPLSNTSQLVNEWASGSDGTNTSGTNAAHPSMYFPG
jgi:hypothetical protein